MVLIALLLVLFLGRSWIAVVCNDLAAWCLESRNQAAAGTLLGLSSFLNDDAAETHYLLAIQTRRERDFAATRQHLKTAFELGWDPAELERQQWIALAQTGQFEEIEGRWEDLFLNAGSDGPEISEAYADLLLARFDLESALTVIAAWELDFPEDPRPHIRRGAVLGVVRNWKDAEQEYLAALELDPDNHEARLELAKCRMEQLRFDEALPDLRRIVQEDPQNDEAIVSLSVCLRRLQRTEEAITLLEENADALGTNLDALREMARARIDREQPEEALKFLAKAIEINPIDREIRYLNAQALQSAGREDDAQAEFDFVNEATRPVLRLTQLVPRLVDEPANIELRYEIADITWKYKSKQEGANWFLSLLQFDPDHSLTHAALARHYEETGEPERAALHRARASSGTPEAD